MVESPLSTRYPASRCGCCAVRRLGDLAIPALARAEADGLIAFRGVLSGWESARAEARSSLNLVVGRDCPIERRRRCRRGMTRVELLLVYVVLALATVLLAGVNRYVQREAKCRLAEDMLLTLRESLPAYHEAVGRYPAEREDHDAERAIAALLSESASAEILKSWPLARAHGPGSGLQLVDPWGTRFRYSIRDDSVLLGAQGSANPSAGTVPLFESAGPDRAFGDADGALAKDNLSSDIPKIFGSVDWGALEHE